MKTKCENGEILRKESGNLKSHLGSEIGTFRTEGRALTRPNPQCDLGQLLELHVFLYF